MTRGRDDGFAESSTFAALLGDLARSPELPVRPAATPTFEPGRRVGRYVIVSLLGRGGMGAVYRARDEVLRRDVALKVLFVDAEDGGVDRFRREVVALAAVVHANVVAVHDAGVDGAQPFVVLDLVEGESLRDRLRTGALPPADVHRLARELVSGLAAAHAVGVIHRDLKPDNVLLDRRGIAKLVDFGLARVASRSDTPELGRTEAGMFLGTAPYMAPEQIRGEDVDHRADYFSLGAVLYEALTGRRAFDAPSRAEVITAVLRDPPPRAPVPDSDVVARRLLGVALRCLEKTPAQRFQSAAEILAALDDDAPAARADAPFDPVPETRYATSSGVHIAYQVVSPPGPITLLAAAPFISNIEVIWESPYEAAWLRALAASTHFIHFDRRGVGMSDPVAPACTIDERVQDLRAVLDAEGVDQTVVLGLSEGGPSALAFAATYPERSRGLVLFGSFARLVSGDGYPHGLGRDAYTAFVDSWVKSWGTPRSLSLPLFVASRARDPDFVRWANRYERQCASPGTVRRLLELQLEIDVRDALARIRCPVLVLHRSGDPCIAVEHGRFLAAQLPGSRYVELDGIDHVPWHGDPAPVLAEIRAFLLSLSPASPAPPDRAG